MDISSWGFIGFLLLEKMPFGRLFVLLLVWSVAFSLLLLSISKIEKGEPPFKLRLIALVVANSRISFRDIVHQQQLISLSSNEAS